MSKKKSGGMVPGSSVDVAQANEKLQAKLDKRVLAGVRTLTNSIALYTYKALILRVIDGDTCVAEIDLGFRMTNGQTLRLLGIDTPELKSKDAIEKTKAQAAHLRLAELVQGKRVIVRTQKTDHFGRYLAQVWLEDGTDVNQQLVDEGYAKPWKA